MKSSEIRRKFVDFFKSKNHTFVPSASSIAIGDKTIFFTIAGMTQFKAALTGEEIRPYKRAVNSQKCIRINDLDDVGKDGRHCTMFEMLGSWSFGDYYKKEAVNWAYELVRDVYKLDLNKIWATVHHTDDEAYELWKQVGVPEERLRRLGDKDNFWSMGPTGPCGPCSELHLDQGIEVGKCNDKTFNCQAGPGCDCDRYLEFWNLVFMQYDRKEDGTLTELPFKSIDTGSGLERITALLQNKTSVFEIDSFDGIKESIRMKAKIPLDRVLNAKESESMNVVCDHIRTLCFTIADGVTFGSEGRGYIVRRVLRRAVRHARRLYPQMPKTESFLADIVPAVIKEFCEFYPEIKENESRIKEAIRGEELRFLATLDNGIEKFTAFVAEQRTAGSQVLTGEQAFSLHDTFGFPVDLTRVMAEEIGFKVDLDSFNDRMKEQKDKSRADAKFYKSDADDSTWCTFVDSKEVGVFTGYEHAPNFKFEEKQVARVELAKGQVLRTRQLKNKLFELVLSNTPFYPEGGGQVADTGWVKFGSDEFEVIDVRKSASHIVHLLKHNDYSDTEASALSADAVKKIFTNPGAEALIDFSSRVATARNHTATHLLHRALQVVLGEGVRQAGSLVQPTGLRFDFSHPQAVTSEELSQVEKIVNEEILKNTSLKVHENVAIEAAKKMGAMAIFDEKYGDSVRVLEVPHFSMELCGGTHVSSTGNIGLFKITSEGSVTSGVRRIEGVTGMGSLELLNNYKHTIKAAANEVGTSEGELLSKIHQTKLDLKEKEKRVEVLMSELTNIKVRELLTQAQTFAGLQAVCALVEAEEVKELELLADRLKEKNVGVVLVGANLAGKASLLAAVHPAAQKQFKNLSAGNIIKFTATLVDGKGGGRPDFARGGGTSPEKLPDALEAAKAYIQTLLS